MESISRRNMLAATGARGLLTASAAAAQTVEGIPQPRRPGHGGTDPGPRNLMRDGQNPDVLVPPSTDHGSLPNLRFSFSDASTGLFKGGWTRQVTVREFGIATTIAGTNMRLNRGGIREMHWHKAAEWAFMLYGNERITAMDAQGRNFVDDVMAPSTNTTRSTSSDWLKHTPDEVLGKNFGVPAALFGDTPDPSERYMFPAAVPGPLSADKIAKATAVAQTFSHRLMAQEPIKTSSGTVRICDSRNFPVDTTIAAALVEVNPGGLREMHWHPNADEWQYYIEGQGRMGVFGACGQARTFDFQAGDAGYVPFAMGHYIENTGTTPLRFLEMFKSSYFADLSLDTWMARTPPELVEAHLKLDRQVMDALRKNKAPVVPA